MDREESRGAAVPLEVLERRVAPIVTLGDVRDREVTGVVFRHDEARSGSLYCCVPGSRVDGHDFAGRARAAGAAAFVCEHSLGAQVDGAVQLVVGPGEARRAMARASCAFFGDPATSLRTVGVTGTNGKTTTTYLLRSVLEENGWSTGVIGTLDGARTTPEAPELQRSLAGFRDRGCQAVALEVTSHALVQDRVDGIFFDVAVFTNLSQDHLDFHETMEAYFSAKASLFDAGRARLAVVNVDDAYGRRLAERGSIETVTYSIADAEGLETSANCSSFTFAGQQFTLHLGGQFNVANALGAATAARALGVPIDTVASGIASASGVPGRFQLVDTLDGVTVIVDYAHTPAALEEVLRAARRVLTGPRRTEVVRRTRPSPREPRLVVVFGAGGERDRGKRPAMGEIASRLADDVVLTSDNPRSEDPGSIIEQVRAGVTSGARCTVEPDRRVAIAAALASSRAGDVVVVAGKGHETTQQLADRTERFDDREVVIDELARQGRALPGQLRPSRGEASA